MTFTIIFHYKILKYFFLKEGDSKKNACETLRQESVAGADLVQRALNCCPKMRKIRRIGAQTVSVSTDETGGR